MSQWQEEVAEEVWACISSGIAQSPSRRQNANSTAALPLLMPLRAQLKRAAEHAQGQSGVKEDAVRYVGAARKALGDIDMAPCNVVDNADTIEQPTKVRRALWDRLPI